MRLYVFPITVPPNTPASTPIRALNSLGGRRIDYGEVWFQNGALGVVGIRFLDNGRQIAPLPEGWITGNDVTVAWIRGYEMEGPPYAFMTEVYSDAEDWPHLLTVRMEVSSG